MNHIIKTQLAFSILILVVVSFFSGCKKEEAPSVTTTSVSDITGSGATSGGNITDAGSSPIISRGVCWGTGTSPTIADFKTSDGTGTGSFLSNITGLAGDMVYYVRAYATNSVGTAYGIALSFTSLGESPIVATSAATNINATKATLNGTVNANDLSTEVAFEYGKTTSYGTIVSATQSPVMGDTSLIVSANITGLTVGTVYHFRIRSVNSLGTSLGRDLTFFTILTDVDGNTYQTVMIGTQEWMQENLRTTRFRNGEIIGTTSSATENIAGQISPRYQWQSSVANSGRYYTFYAITDSRSVCPEGWHVPTDAELITLTDYLSANGYGYKGKEQYIAKSMAATSGWVPDTTSGNVGNDQGNNNSSGFTAIAGGGRYSNGVVNFVGYHSIWWSSTESGPTAAFFRCVGYIPGEVFRGEFNKSYGLPVRCLQDH